MKFFLDTAELSEVRQAVDTGLIDGMTTNPTLLSRAAGAEGDPRAILEEICRLVPGPVSAEVVGTETAAMVTEGRQLAAIADNIVVKVPLTVEGLKACAQLRAQDIKVNVTLCFSPAQALLAAKVGATYISPFVGRIDDVGGDGMELIDQVIQIYRNYGFDTEVLVASVRHPQHVVQAALLGAHVATMPTKVLFRLFDHPLTEKGLAGFLADWKKLPEGKRML